MSIDNHFNLLLLIECVWYVIMLKQFYLAAWGGDLSGSFFTIINKNKFFVTTNFNSSDKTRCET